MIDTEKRLHNDDYYYDIVRDNIKNMRIKNNFTQQQLADMSGLSRSYICDIENKNRHKYPTIAVVGRIADALEIDIYKLFEIRGL